MAAKGVNYDYEGYASLKPTFRCFINIEVQINPDPDYAVRSLYYWACLYQNQLERGIKYDNLRPTVCINFLAFSLFENHDDYHSCFHITEMGKPENILTDDLQIHFIEVGKPDLDIGSEPGNNLESWCYFFRNEGYMEEFEMPVLLKKNNLIGKAETLYDSFTRDEHKMAAAQSHEMWLHDQASIKKHAERDGLAKGMMQKARKDAAKMFEEGLDIDLIARVTELDKEILKGIKNQIDSRE